MSLLSWRSVALLAVLRACSALMEATYHNQFAVHVPAGEDHVEDIARRHGFVNHGQCVPECSKGFFSEAGRCTRCIHGCSECVSRLNCTSCSGSLRLQSGACRTSCADGYYADRGTCSKCYLSCRTCIGPRRDQCASCPLGWRLAAGECHLECPQGFYQSVGGCRRCHHYCRECDGSGPLHCKSCPPRFMLDGGLCMECLGSQYYEDASATCKSCHSSCRSCSGAGKFGCTSCSRPLRLDRLNNQCVPCCSERGIPANSSTAPDCCHCNPDNGECINSSVAGKRRIAEWGALHTAANERTPAPTVSSVTTTVLAAAAAVFLAVLFVLQMRTARRPKTKAHGAIYSPLTCNEEGEAVASDEFAVARPNPCEHVREHEHEHEPLL